MIEIEMKTVSEVVHDIEFGVDFAIARVNEGKFTKIILIAQEFSRIKKPGYEGEKLLEKPEIIEICKVE